MIINNIEYIAIYLLYLVKKKINFLINNTQF